jgi:hypothetical protein
MQSIAQIEENEYIHNIPLSTCPNLVSPGWVAIRS